MDESTTVTVSPRWIAAAVVGFALAAIFGSLWIGARGTDPSDVGDFLGTESPDATAAAVDVITAITTYDSTTIEDRRAELLDLSTGDFQDDYEQLLAGGLGDVLEDEGVASEGDIVDGPTVGFTTATNAIAVARVVQDVTSRSTPGGRTMFVVLRLGLVKIDDRWKADSLKVLSQQVL